MNVDTMPGPGGASPDDLAEIAAADMWLDTVAGRTPLPDDPLASALTGWLDGIDDEYIPMPAPPRRLRSHRSKVVAVAAAGALLVTGVGTAAAATGTPLNRLIFGDPHPSHSAPVTPTAAQALWQAATLTSKAAKSIDAAEKAGGISSTDRQTVTGELSSARVLLAPLEQSQTRSTLQARISSLRQQLSQLPSLTPSAPAAPVIPAAPAAGSGSSSGSGDTTTAQKSGSGSTLTGGTTTSTSSGSDDSHETSGSSHESSDSGSHSGSDN